MAPHIQAYPALFTTLDRLFRLLNRRERLGFMALVGAMLLEGMLEIAAISAVPLYITLVAYPDQLPDRLTPTLAKLDRADILLLASSALFGFFALKVLANTTVHYVKVRYAQNRARHISTRLYRAYLQAPYLYHLRRNSAELIRNLNTEAMQLSQQVFTPLIDMLSQGIIILAVLMALVFYVPPTPLLILLSTLGLAAAAVHWQHRRMKNAGTAAQHHRGQLIQTATEGLGGVKELKLLGRQEHFIERFDHHFRKLMDRERFNQVVARFAYDWLELAAVLSLLGIVVLLFHNGKTPAQVLQIATVCTVALARIKGSLSRYLHNFSFFQHHRASLEAIQGDLETLAMEDQSTPVPAPCPFHEHIRLERVSFRYPHTDQDVLRQIDLTIRKGEALGFVGKSGSGKSTLIDLIVGLLDPTTGTIFIDETPLPACRRAWQRRIGYVPQMIHLIDGTLRENIALGLATEDIDEDALRRAANQAQLDELIGGLPKGLETVIGERGIRLSGGQRQRIAIARALYHDPEIIVFDEATSALDRGTEAEVIRAVERLKGDRTVLMIAHRISTLDGCDRILKLSAGRLHPWTPATGPRDPVAITPAHAHPMG